MKISSKLLIVFFCLISLNTNVVACYGTADTLTRKKVGLVLSGGGAKGAAHVGVLKILEETGIPIDYIAGTSMGAIVGGLYAVGYSPAKIDSILRSQNWQELLTDKIPRDKMLFVEKKVTDKTIISIPFEKKRIDLPTGILSGGAILNMLSFFTTGYHDMATFDSLPIPFACIGYDLITGKEVVMRSGNLATAIRASMSIPGAFTMVERDDHILIDGGVINNFPVDVIRQMGADIVIGVDVSAITDTHAKIEKKAQEIPKEEFYGSLPFILQKLMDRMGTEKLQDNIKITDFYIHPKVEPYTTASFNAEAIDSLIHRGEQIALAYKDSLLALKKEIGIAENSRVNIDSLYRKGHNGYPVSDSIYIGKIFFEGIGFLDEQNLKQMLRIKENSHTTHKQIHNGLDRLKGSGFFSAVSYELNEYKGSYDLIISCKKRLNNFAGLGLRFDNKNIVTSFLQTNIAPAKLHGAVIDIKTRISLNPYLDACLYYQNAYIGRFGLSYHFNLGNYPLSSGLDTITNHVRSLTNRLNIELANFHYRNFNFFLTLQYENYTPLSCSFFRNSEDFSYPDPENLYIYRTGVNFDSFDNYYFPHSGTEFHAEYAVYTDDFSHYKEEHPFSVLSANISGAIPVSGHLTLLPGGFLRFVSRNGTPFNVQNFIGGYFPSNYTEQQIPFYGLHHISVVKKQLWGANLKAQYRFGNNHYAWIKLNFANFCESLNDILSQENLVSLFGGAVGYSFQSPLGPIDIMFDYCYFKGSKPGIFINFGKNF